MIGNFIQDIKKAQLNHQDRVYKHSHWSKEFATTQLFNNFEKLDGKKITRRTVIDEFIQYYKYSKSINALQPFFCCMLWGYANDNRGASRTKQYFDQNKGAEKNIKNALLNIKANTEQAFQDLINLKMLGISFASKLLYFAGKASGMKEYPLIFDTRVCRGLLKISTTNIISSLISVTPHDNWDSYNKYNNLIHEWAKKYKIEADKIEKFLFDIGSV